MPDITWKPWITLSVFLRKNRKEEEEAKIRRGSGDLVAERSLLVLFGRRIQSWLVALLVEGGLDS